MSTRKFDSHGRYLKRTVPQGFRRGMTLASCSEILRDYYSDGAHITKKINAAAKRTGVHADVIRLALGHRVVPPPHSARDRRIAKRVARNWVGSKFDVMERLMRTVYKESPFLALLPKKVTPTAHAGSLALASGVRS